MGDELNFGLKKPEPAGGEKEEVTGEESKASVSSDMFSDEKVQQIIENAKVETQNLVNTFCCMIIGKDGTAKTGIQLDYCMTLPKKTMYLDLDSGARPIYNTYHKAKDTEQKIIMPRLYEEKEAKDMIAQDYPLTIAKISALVMYVKKHSNDYSAIVIDGISTLLKYCEYLMRINKNIAPDGGVSLRYWIQRNKRFTELLDFMKEIPNIDTFYVGHEDFILQKDSAAVKAKTNQMVHQRIVCSRVTDKVTKEVSFVAKIDKCKYNLALEGKEYTFARVPKTGEATWDTSEIFKGLK